MGNWIGTIAAAERRLEGLEGAVEARALAVGPREHDDARQFLRLGFLPHLLGLHFGAGDRVDRHQDAVHDAQRGAGVAEEVGEPGRVDRG